MKTPARIGAALAAGALGMLAVGALTLASVLRDAADIFDAADVFGLDLLDDGDEGGPLC